VNDLRKSVIWNVAGKKLRERVVDSKKWVRVRKETSLEGRRDAEVGKKLCQARNKGGEGGSLGAGQEGSET